MKRRLILPGFAIAALMLFGFAGTAMANDYNGQCAGAPPSVTGNYTIVDGGDCNVGDLSAGGFILISAAGSITTGNLTANGGDVTISPGGGSGGTATTGTITASGKINITADFTINTQALTTTNGDVILKSNADKITVNGAISTPGRAISVWAAKNISLATLSTDNTSSATSIRIFANQSTASSAVFQIGASNPANGLTLAHSNTTSGNSYIYINNGGSGGIDYQTDNALQVMASGGKAGQINLTAPGGTVILRGNLNADGSGDFGAGSITLNAAQIETHTGALVSTSQTMNAPAANKHNVNIAAGGFNMVDGDFKIVVNGIGDSPSFSNVYISPAGNFTQPVSPDPLVVILPPTLNYPNSPFMVSGAGTFEIDNNGRDNGINMWGSPLNISPTTAFKVFANGSNTLIGLYSGQEGPSPTLTTLTLGGGAGELHAQTQPSIGQTVNEIRIQAGSFSQTSTGNILLDATGTAGSKGGLVDILATSGPLKLGTTAAKLSINAGTVAGGDAGTISIGGGTDMQVADGSSLLASASGADGKGGQILLTGHSLSNTAAAGDVTIAANGFGARDGGTVKITSVTDVDLRKIVLSAIADPAGSGNGGAITVLSNGNIQLRGAKVSVAAGGAMTSAGNGGLLDFEPQGSLTMNGNLHADAAKGGTAGFVTLKAGQNITFAGDANGNANKITANGNGQSGCCAAAAILPLSAPIPNIDIQAAGSITVGSAQGQVDLTAKGLSQGDQGGAVRVHSSAAPVVVNGANVTVFAGQDGNGGVIVAEATASTITVNGVLDASGKGPDGKGGIILITGSFSQLVGTLDASAKGGGDGGEVVLTTTGTDPIDLSQAIIKANGGTNAGSTGLGGTFAANKAAGNPNTPDVSLDVNTIIYVDGGPKLAPDKFDGLIQLNEVPCQQWKIANNQGNPRNNWPFTYWDCTSTSNQPSPLDQVPASVASGPKFNNLSILLGTVELYVFPGNVSYNAFFADKTLQPDGSHGQPPQAGGITFRVGAHTYSNPWQSGSIGGPNPQPYDDAMYHEVAAHELGHAVDIGFGLQSRTGTYNAYVQRDSYDLDNVFDPSQNTFIRRLPCKETVFGDNTKSSDKPPFAGVTDLATGRSVCINGQLDPASFPGNPPNDQVLLSLEPGLWNPPAGKTWLEVHAQAFAYGVGGNQGARPMNDKVLDNGAKNNAFFGCIKAWAGAERAGNAMPNPAPNSPSGSCAVVPGP